MSKDTRTAFGQMFDQQRETGRELEKVTKDLKELLSLHNRIDEEGYWRCDHYEIPEDLQDELNSTLVRLGEEYL